MSVDTEIYAEMESAVLAACDDYMEGGPEPIGWRLTWALYQQLDYGGDHFVTAPAAFGNSGVKPLYQLPVSLCPGAHHGWELMLRPA